MTEGRGQMTEDRETKKSDKKKNGHFNDIYKKMPLEDIPWNSEEPPELLVELVEGGKVKPLDPDKIGARGRLGRARLSAKPRALDLGCGLGNYAIWLASKGFEVVGVDASPTAIKTAKQNARLRLRFAGQARRKKVKCKFLVADLTGDWPDLGEQFDFVYDWGLLHHIAPKQRLGYVKNVHNVLKPAGKYVSVCFNEKDSAFEGGGKVRNTQLGTVVYLSSEKELRVTFGRFFKIVDFRVLEIMGKVMTHVFNYCFMERKGF
jgi:SAM-dependent methyltransferase